METMNQILLQLREADRHACARNPHYRRLAVVLLDNLVELQLNRKAETEFLFDDTTWYRGVRKFNQKKRREVKRRHPALLAFAKERNWINENEVLLLGFAHEVRNGFYHRGEDDDTDAETAIRLLYNLVKDKFPKWKTGYCISSSGSGKLIDIADAPDDDGRSTMRIGGVDHEHKVLDFLDGKEEYWQKAINAVLTYKPDGDIRPLIHKKAMRIVRNLERDLKYARDNTGSTCLDILSGRFTVLTPAFSVEQCKGTKIKNPIYAINVYLSLQKDEDRLRDIDDVNERAIECHRLMDAHKHNPNPMPRSLLKKYAEQADSILTCTEGQGMARYLKIKKDLDAVATAASEFVRDLDGYRERD
jgi:hypothetical protein